MSEYGHSALCDCAVCDDIAFRKSVRQTVMSNECDISHKAVSISLRSNNMKPHFGQSDAVMNKLAGIGKHESSESFKDRYEGKWPVQKEFCCDEATNVKAELAECKQLLQKHSIHMVSKNCWCNPTVENDCCSEPETSLAKEKPVYMGEPFYVWLSKLSLYETRFTVEEQKEFLKAAFVAGANEERDRRKQDSEFSDWKDAECNAHMHNSGLRAVHRDCITSLLAEIERLEACVINRCDEVERCHKELAECKEALECECQHRDAYRQERDAIRQQTVEECAMIADSHYDSCTDCIYGGQDTYLYDVNIAAAIRDKYKEN